MPAEDTAARVADRYRLDAVIGSGGVGRVWRGLDTVLRRDVAVKEVPLPVHLPDDERDALRARVLREARAAARIHHPGSVQVFDVVDEVATIYVVMELVEERTLAEVVAEDGPLEPVAAASMGVELLGALEAAHRVGVVHRDVKPRNVLVAPTGAVKLADFGIASVLEDPGLTKTGVVMGTPAYMSPEQATGDPVGPPSDLWSTGALLYHAVEGRPPFERPEPMATLHAVVNDEPAPFRRAGAVAPVIAALLAKDPAERLDLATARARLAAVVDATSGDDATAGVALGDPAGATVASPVTARAVPDEATRVEAIPAPARPRPGPDRRPLVAGLAAVVALLGVGGVVLAAQDDDGADTPADAAASPTVTVPTTVAPATTAPPSTAPAGADDPVATTTTAAPTTTAPPAADGAERPAGVPETWTSYRDETVGWTVFHPADWMPTPASGTSVDFRAPDGAYLRVDSTGDPGDDPVAAWEESSARFADRYPDYEELRIEPISYQGYESAIWEYTYRGQRATNIGIVADDIGTGFALNFQAPAGRWDELSDVREAFEAGFVIPR